MLPRERLVARLHRRGDERIVALLAPAGYGKSTALLQWQVREAVPLAWVSLDAADADPIRLLAHVVVAVDRAVGLDPAVLEAVNGTRASAIDNVVPRLTSSLHRDETPLMLVLDDVHAIAGSASVDVVSMLIDYLPRHVVVALAGRSDAGLPLARYRSHGDLLELSTRELALDREEAATILRRHDRHLGAAEVDALYARTEGWPALVYLAARRLAEAGGDGTGSGGHGTGRDGNGTGRDGGAAGRDGKGTGRDGGGAGQGRAGTGRPGRAPERTERADAADPARILADYLDAELLSGVSPAVRRFLVQTSVLERLTGGLCDAVTGRRGSARILRDLAATNLLVAPLGPGDTWYRCHPLLRDHLRTQLDEHPAERRELHRRAAAWLAAEGLADAAIEHHLAGGDTDAAAETVTSVALAAYRDGRTVTLGRWIEAIGEDGLRRHPYVAAVAAWSALLAGRAADAERSLHLADGASYGERRPAAAASFETMRASARAMMARNGFAAALADAEWAAEHEPPGSTWRPAVLAVLGTMRLIAGDPERAEVALRDAAELAAGTPALRAFASAQAWRAALAIERGDWAAAATRIAAVDDAIAGRGHEPDAISAAVGPIAARVAMSRGDVRGAARQMAGFQAARTSLGTATPWLSVRVLVEAARAYLALGEPAGARTALNQADDILVRCRDLGPLADQVAEVRALLRGLPPGPAGASTLTPAELRVLRLLPTYLTAPEMAQRLFVAPNTVKTQIQSIYGKLGASSRAEAVGRAIEAGLLEPLPALAGEPITRS